MESSPSVDASPPVLPSAGSWRRWLLLGLLAIACYEAPYVFLGEKAPVRILDGFDHLFAVHAAMHSPWNRDSGQTLNFLLGGLPKVATAMECRVIVALFHCLPPYWAYRANDAILRVVAFVGMLLLLGRFPFGARALAFAVALEFAFLPYWSPAGLTVAGQPLLILCWLALLRENLPKGRLALAWAAFFAFPFYSSLPHLGGVFLLLFGALWLWRAFRTRRLQLRLLAAVALLALGYLLANWPFLVQALSDHPIVWHRTEWSKGYHMATLKKAIQAAEDLVLRSQYHADANPFPFVWLALAEGLGFAFVRWIASRVRAHAGVPPAPVESPGSLRWTLALTAAIAAIALVTFFWYETWLLNLPRLLRRMGPTLASYNLRLYFFYPLLFSLLFYCALATLGVRRWLPRLFVIALVVAQLRAEMYYSDLLAGRFNPAFQSFSEYQSAALFDQAERLVGQPRNRFRIACLGFLPAMAHLNGFRTVDGYWYLYPLAYKHRFRPVIETELWKSPLLRGYFEDWGSRCYLFSAELGPIFAVRKDTPPPAPVSQLWLNTSALRALGASYLFSAVQIQDAKSLRLRGVGIVRDKNAAMSLYIYAL